MHEHGKEGKLELGKSYLHTADLFFLFLYVLEWPFQFYFPYLFAWFCWLVFSMKYVKKGQMDIESGLVAESE